MRARDEKAIDTRHKNQAQKEIEIQIRINPQNSKERLTPCNFSTINLLTSSILHVLCPAVVFAK